MTKNELIEILNQIPGNVDICLHDDLGVLDIVKIAKVKTGKARWFTLNEQAKSEKYVLCSKNLPYDANILDKFYLRIFNTENI